MTPEYQHELIKRIRTHQAAGRGSDSSKGPVTIAASRYTDRDRLDAERDVLRDTAQLVGLSGLVAGPGSFATVDVGDVGALITRDEAGKAHAFANACRHRGARVADGCGETSRLVCPYHGWSYDLAGRSVRRRGDQYFDSVDSADLIELPLVEDHGLLWVAARPSTTIDPSPLAGAEVEIGPLGLERMELFDQTSFTRRLNWKLAIDTFTESWHVPVLHRDTLAPLIHGDFSLFDTFGPHGRLIAARCDIDTLDDHDPDASLLPHATILWFVLPNTVLIHQQDHVQVYRSRPGTGPHEAVLDVALYVPGDSERSDGHWRRNFDLLVEVTDNEDFSTAAGIQHNLETGLLSEVVFGANEPALQHFHSSLDRSLRP